LLSKRLPTIHMLTILSLCVLATLAPTSGSLQKQVLFLGNSYTGANVPNMVEGLATSAGHTLITDRNTPGGNTLGAPQSGGQPHMSNATSLAKIASAPWDFVVLQEQSVLPTIPSSMNNYMYPGAQSLAASIAANDPNNEILMYQTWGRESGGTYCWGGCNTFADFDEMQDSLTSAYAGCGELIGADVAQVGEAWRLARELSPGIGLHANDGAHPNLKGGYLASCVIFAKIFDESPVGIAYTGGLDASRALFLQEVAARVVFCGDITPFCPASVNSTGVGADMTLSSGTASIAANDLTFSVSGLPANVYGLFFYGAGQSSTPFGDGTLCISGSLSRLSPVQSDISGTVLRALDLEASPFSDGPLPPSVGAPHHFQFWYRDPSGPGGSGFNVSSGLSVTYCP
jgi:hypothetical protein